MIGMEAFDVTGTHDYVIVSIVRDIEKKGAHNMKYGKLQIEMLKDIMAGGARKDKYRYCVLPDGRYAIMVNGKGVYIMNPYNMYLELRKLNVLEIETRWINKVMNMEYEYYEELQITENMKRITAGRKRLDIVEMSNERNKVWVEKRKIEMFDYFPDYVIDSRRIYSELIVKERGEIVGILAPYYNSKQ